MKKTTTFLICLLLACTGWVLAQQSKLVPSILTKTFAPATPKHLYLRGGKTHLILQPTRTVTRVYRKVGNLMLPMY